MNRKLHGESCCWGIAVNIADNRYVILWYNTNKAPFRKCEERKKENSALWTNTEVLLIKVQWMSSDEFQKGILLD